MHAHFKSVDKISVNFIYKRYSELLAVCDDVYAEELWTFRPYGIDLMNSDERSYAIDNDRTIHLTVKFVGTKFFSELDQALLIAFSRLATGMLTTSLAEMYVDSSAGMIAMAFGVDTDKGALSTYGITGGPES